MTDTGIVPIHGKEYQTVPLRVKKFREDHPDWTISTEILKADDDFVIIKATIRNEDGREIATGTAEERRGSTTINKTSALENCETSAVGRALAFFKYVGTEIASANEVADAINNQKNDEWIEYNALVREHWDWITEIKSAVANRDRERFHAVYDDYKDKHGVRKALFLAPTKGGIFEGIERDVIKTPSILGTIV